MKTPPLLIAAALLFWGWQTDFLFWASLMAVAVESSRWIKFRLEFSETDLNRIWDLCGLLFGGTFAFLYSSQEIRQPAFIFPQWLPFVFLPMILAQAFGTAEAIGMKTFSWFLRWRKAKSDWAERRANFAYIYFTICLFGASTTNKFGAVVTEHSFNWYFFGLAVVLGWALLAIRPKRVPLPLWFCILGLLFGTGFVAQRALHQAQARIEATVGSWIIRWLGKRQTDTTQSRTAIGHIGKLKLSGRIILRVAPADKDSAPDLLREATYVTYKNENWFAGRAEYAELPATKNDSWTLSTNKAEHGATIYTYMNNGSGVLALPLGTSEITNLTAAVRISPFGTLRVDEAFGLLSYFVAFAPNASDDSPPGDTDMSGNVPPVEREMLQRVAHRLELDSPSKTSAEKMKILQRYFANEFSYSTYISEDQVDRTGKKTPLAMFLETTHKGHCEYFASATVLLARVAGIPARYATGYSVQETSKSGKTLIVRERHAHAWALLWDGAHWQNFDTTPASWDEVEEKNASMFEPLSDLWSSFSFEFAKWRYSKTSYQKYLIWALIPLVLILVWRIVFNKERKKRHTDADAERKMDWPGLDSEFYRIETRLTEIGLSRGSGESLRDWRRRIADALPAADPDLDQILILHQRYRFDPRGISSEERQGLSQRATAWLKREKATTAAVK